MLIDRAQEGSERTHNMSNMEAARHLIVWKKWVSWSGSLHALFERQQKNLDLKWEYTTADFGEAPTAVIAVACTLPVNQSISIRCYTTPYQNVTMTPNQRQAAGRLLWHLTPKSDQFQISPAASIHILHHTVWRTSLFIAYSDERWLYYQFSLLHWYISL